jgi:hypothetical protein
VHQGKYAQLERERRFLLAEPPLPLDRQPHKIIWDRYLEGTSLRLRKVCGVPGGETAYKLSHKVLAGPGDFAHAFITNIYLSEREYQLLTVHPARELQKRR